MRARCRSTAATVLANTAELDVLADENGNPQKVAGSRLGQKLLPDVKLGIFRKESFGGKDFAGGQIAGGDVFLVFNVLARIDEDGPELFLDGVVLGPFGQHNVGGVEQLNLDSLIGRKIERDHA